MSCSINITNIVEAHHTNVLMPHDTPIITNKSIIYIRRVLALNRGVLFIFKFASLISAAILSKIVVS